MGRRMVFRRPNGRFRRAPSLEEMGFPVAKAGKECECGHCWNPLVTTGKCPKCGSQAGTMLDDYVKGPDDE